MDYRNALHLPVVPSLNYRKIHARLERREINIERTGTTLRKNFGTEEI